MPNYKIEGYFLRAKKEEIKSRNTQPCTLTHSIEDRSNNSSVAHQRLMIRTDKSFQINTSIKWVDKRVLSLVVKAILENCTVTSDGFGPCRAGLLLEKMQRSGPNSRKTFKLLTFERTDKWS